MLNKANFIQIEAIVSRYAEDRLPTAPYRKFLKGRSQSAEFIRGLLSGDLDPKQSHRLVRSRALKQLLSYIFHLDLRKGKLSPYAAKYYGNLRSLFLSKVLLMVGVRSVAMKIISRGLREAKFL